MCTLVFYVYITNCPHALCEKNILGDGAEELKEMVN